MPSKQGGKNPAELLRQESSLPARQVRRKTNITTRALLSRPRPPPNALWQPNWEGKIGRVTRLGTPFPSTPMAPQEPSNVNVPPAASPFPKHDPTRGRDRPRLMRWSRGSFDVCLLGFILVAGFPSLGVRLAHLRF